MLGLSWKRSPGRHTGEVFGCAQHFFKFCILEKDNNFTWRTEHLGAQQHWVHTNSIAKYKWCQNSCETDGSGVIDVLMSSINSMVVIMTQEFT